MKISEVVDRLKAEFPALSLSKVRYLEGEGLIAPFRVGNGYRRYSQADGRVDAGRVASVLMGAGPPGRCRRRVRRPRVPGS